MTGAIGERNSLEEQGGKGSCEICGPRALDGDVICSKAVGDIFAVGLCGCPTGCGESARLVRGLRGEKFPGACGENMRLVGSPPSETSGEAQEFDAGVVDANKCRDGVERAEAKVRQLRPQGSFDEASPVAPHSHEARTFLTLLEIPPGATLSEAPKSEPAPLALLGMVVTLLTTGEGTVAWLRAGPRGRGLRALGAAETSLGRSLCDW